MHMFPVTSFNTAQNQLRLIDSDRASDARGFEEDASATGDAVDADVWGQCSYGRC